MNHEDDRHSTGNVVNGIVIALYGDRLEVHVGSTVRCGDLSGSLCYIPATNITLCVNFNFKKVSIQLIAL